MTSDAKDGWARLRPYLQKVSSVSFAIYPGLLVGLLLLSLNQPCLHTFRPCATLTVLLAVALTSGYGAGLIVAFLIVDRVEPAWTRVALYLFVAVLPPVAVPVMWFWRDNVCLNDGELASYSRANSDAHEAENPSGASLRRFLIIPQVLLISTVMASLLGGLWLGAKALAVAALMGWFGMMTALLILAVAYYEQGEMKLFLADSVLVWRHMCLIMPRLIIILIPVVGQRYIETFRAERVPPLYWFGIRAGTVVLALSIPSSIILGIIIGFGL